MWLPPWLARLQWNMNQTTEYHCIRQSAFCNIECASLLSLSHLRITGALLLASSSGLGGIHIAVFLLSSSYRARRQDGTLVHDSDTTMLCSSRRREETQCNLLPSLIPSPDTPPCTTCMTDDTQYACPLFFDSRPAQAMKHLFVAPAVNVPYGFPTG
jgi:hypothetical protein